MKLKKLYSFLTLLTAFLWLGSGSVWGDELTIYESETGMNSYVPYYGLYLDATGGQHNQFIIPGSELEAIQGATITGMKFYTGTPGSVTGTLPIATVSLANTTTSSLSGLVSETLTQVWSKQIAISSNSWTLSFDSEFAYTNGNILVDIVTPKGGYQSASFYGKTVTGAAYCYNGQRDFVPKITFTYEESCTSCCKPSLNLVDRDNESASFEWTPKGDETNWQYLYLPAGTALTDSHWDGATSTTATSATIDGLSEQTEYVFYVRADCGSSAYSKVANKPFKTKCVTATVPFTYGFEASEGASTGSIPDCWVAIAPSGAGGYPMVDAGFVKEGSNKLHFQGKGSTATPQYVVLPEFDVPVKYTKVSFWFRRDADYSYTSKPQLGYFSTEEPTSTSTFTSLGTPSVSLTTSYQRYELDLKDAPAGAKRIAIKFNGGTSSSYTGGLFIDSIKVVSTQDCSAPQNVVLDGTTTSTADFSWTANAGVDTYKYCVVAQGEEPDWSADSTATTNAAHVTNLTSGNYTFYVKCACGTAVSDAVNFSIVSCGVPTNMQFSNATYNSVTVSWTSAGETEWDLQYKIGDLGFGSPIHLTGASYSFSEMTTGTPYTVQVKAACKPDFSAGDYLEGVFTPSYTAPVPIVSEETDAQATVTWAAVTGADSYEYVVMPGTTAADWTSPGATTALSATLTGLTGGSDYTVYVRSVYGGSRSAAASAAFSTTTIAPNTPTVDDYDASSATLSWTNSGAATQYQWACKASGTPGDGDWSAATTATSVEVTGLTSNTNYTFYVRSYYAEGKVSASASKGFKTDCGAYSMPFSQAFAYSIPACWDVDNYTGGYKWASSSSYKVSSSYSMDYYANAATDQYSDMITPSIILSQDAYLIFQIRNNMSVNGELYIDNGSSTTKLKNLRSTSTAFVADTTDLSYYTGQTVKLIFRGYGANNYVHIYIDDVSVTAIPCDKPAFTAANIAVGDASATISCAESKWNLKYRTNGVGDWTTISNITEASRTITGLTNGTTYEVQIQAVCSATRSSDWTASQTFTPVACPAVEAVTLSAKIYNSVTVNCTLSAVGTWDLQYKIGEGEWTAAYSDIATASQAFTVAVGNTYSFRVKSSCGSDWTEVSETYAPVYAAPASASVGSISDVTASASWDAVADASGYEYLVTSGEPNWASATATTETSADLSGLVGGTNYTLYVRSSYPESHYSVATSAAFVTSTIAPKSLTNTAVTTTTATFTWGNDGAATQYQWACKVSGTPEESDWNGPIDEATYTVNSGLVAASTYTFYVRSYYDAGKVSASVSKSFTTACDVIQTADLPWTSDLSSLNCYPHASTSDGAYGVDIYNSSEFRFTGGSTNSGRKVVVALPEFEENIQNLKIQITYQTKGTSANYPGFYIGYITDVDNVATSYSDISGATKYQSTTSTTTSFVSLSAVPSTAKRIAICYRTNGASSSVSYGSSYISSIHVEAAGCPAPASIDATEILPDGATIEWTGTATRYQYAVVDQNVEPTSWTLLDENVYSLTLHEYAPGATHDVWVRSYCDATHHSDSIKTSFAAVCPAPTDPTVSSITETTATLSWTAASGITDYQYVVLAKDAAEDWTGAVKVEGAITADLSGLAANTAYDVYVRSFYSNVSHSASVKASFRTACAAIGSLPYTETFESQNANEVPACWDVILVEGSEYPAIYTSTSSSHYHNGSKGLLINNKHLKYGFAILPEFEAALSTLQISFWHKEESSSASNCGNLELGYLTNIADSTTFHLIKKCNLNSSWVEESEISLADVPAGARLAFRYIGKNTSWEYYTAIDDITIEVRPSCPKPKDVIVSAITAHTASVAWTNGSTETAWALQTSTDGSNWSAEIPADENPFPLTGLEAQTSYYVRVKAVCGVGDESEWSEPSDIFPTKCESAELPFEEYFDNGSTLPACWSASAWGSSANQWTIYTYNGHSGSNSARYYARTSTSNYADLTTAPIAIEANTQLKFYHTNSSCTGEVYVDNGSAQTKLMDITSAADWTLETIDLSAYAGSSINIIFRAKGAGTSASRYFYLDDVRVIKGITLADNENNTATIASYIGQTIDVTIGRTLYCDGDYNTICLPFDLPTLEGTPLAGGELWSFRYGYVENGELLMRVAPASSIAAGVPYLITFASGANIVNPIFTNVTIIKSAGVSVGQTDDVQFIGILKPQPFTENDKNNLFVATGGMLAWSEAETGAANSYLRSFRGFFHTETAVNGTPVTNGMRARIIKQEQVATGIEDVRGDVQSLKLLENGRVVIIRNGVKYSVQGQVISK